MLITPLHIDQLMQQSLIGARADDPVIPDRTPRRAKHRRARKLRLALTRKSAAASAHPSASKISSSTTSPPRSVTS